MGRLPRLGVPRSHQSIGGAPCSWPAVTWTLPMLQNFQSSFAAHEYLNNTPSTSEALSSPLRNWPIAPATCATTSATRTEANADRRTRICVHSSRQIRGASTPSTRHESAFEARVFGDAEVTQ